MTLPDRSPTPTLIEMSLSLTEAASALRDGEVTSVELTVTALRRADDLDPRFGLYRSRLDAHAMDAASRADADFATGRDRGFLQGIPVALEDIPTVADGPGVEPSAVLDPAWAAEQETPAGARIRRAGAVVIGKVSSTGTGMGVAAGLFLAGVGLDTGGGVRISAGLCGISGLVPTSGRVPVGCRRDHVAPLARSARDCAAVLGVIAGHRPGNAGDGDGTAGEYLGALCGSLAGVRLGVVGATPDPDDTDPAVSGLVDDAVAVLGDLGADVVEVTLPSRRDDVAALFADVDAVVGAMTAASSWEAWDRPVLVLHMGFGARGLPLSLEITGRPFDEATVLRVGDAYQQITAWHRSVAAV